MQLRIPGFDLARAWAIFGMFIVNFQITFGNFTDPSLMSRFLNLFTGNSSASFVILAGMGVSLLTFRLETTVEEQKRLKRIVLNRSWFLFGLGLLLYPWQRFRLDNAQQLYPMGWLAIVSCPKKLFL